MTQQTQPSPCPTPGGAAFAPRWWVAGDLNALFGLGTNNLLNLLVLTGLLLGVVEVPAELVFGRILPAVGVMLCLTNAYYAYLARELARSTGRSDVTALPSGASVPHMFIVVMVVMLPVKISTGDPILAWHAGVAWVFLEGLVILAGSFVAPAIRRLTPSAALLGTLAGVSIAFISLKPMMEIFMNPWIGLPALVIILGGWFAGVRFPLGLPAALVAVVVGVAIALVDGQLQLSGIGEAFEHVGFHLPLLQPLAILSGLENVWPLLVTAIPFGVYDFIEAMNNVESAEQGGDSYPLRKVLVALGCTSLVGTLLGSPFANAVYIGHPGWKQAGGRIGYSLATGVLILAVCLLGVVPVLLSLIPLPAVLPILLYVSLLVAAQAFQTNASRYAPAIVFAMVPHFAAWGLTLVDGSLDAVGASAVTLGSELAQRGILYEGMFRLGQGAIISGLLFGAITVFLIDRRFSHAAGYALAGGVLSFFGFIHGPAIGWAVSPQLAGAYGLVALMCWLFRYCPQNELCEEAAH
ncbi:regulator [Crenobacter caeni]|uniref:Regulator n=1 Tax=Crenobacter caeni TaxID=2705474 RepID=A0A6B2KTI3_9NEIS|nr:regulator [Crenobacter caeni]NDV13556.1 regulator [Crenobacter caeni]